MMDWYRGLADGDQITDGGAFVDENNRGSEICNFLAHDSSLFGYVEPSGESKQLNMKRLGASIDDDMASNITVVWTARRRGIGNVIVGLASSQYQNKWTFRHPSARLF